MQLLLSAATVYPNGGAIQEKYDLYKASSAEKHAVSDQQTLTFEFKKALTAPVSATKVHQGNGVYRVKVNNGNGYVVYKTPAQPNLPKSACIFHFHWHYNLDLPLVVSDQDV